VGWENTAVRRGWIGQTGPTSSAELAPHIPTGPCNRKTSGVYLTTGLNCPSQWEGRT